MEELKEKYFKKLCKLEEDKRLDNEVLHSVCDECIIELLKELGFKEIAEKYLQLKDDYFWYA